MNAQSRRWAPDLRSSDLFVWALLGTFALSLALGAQTSQRSCYRYAPDTVRLTGVLQRDDEPKKAMESSTTFANTRLPGLEIRMLPSICTIGGGGTRTNEPQKNVSHVRLLASATERARLFAHLGSVVSLQGTLTASHIGGHQEPVTISASSPVEIVNDSRRLAEIREWAKVTTRTLAGDRVVKRELSGFSTEGGELVAWYDSDTLRKLSAAFYGESGRSTEEYFVRDGQPYFTFLTYEQYDHSSNRNVAHTYRTRLYFDRDRLIRWIDSTGRVRGVTDSESDARAHDELEIARVLVACAMSHIVETCEYPRDSASER